jgi:hypothetical protein
VGFDAAKIGELGTQLVLKEIETSDETRQPTVLTVKPTLIVRGSTGPPAPREFSMGTPDEDEEMNGDGRLG